MAWLWLSGAWRQGAGTVPADGTLIKKTALYRGPGCGRATQLTGASIFTPGKGERPRESTDKTDAK